MTIPRSKIILLLDSSLSMSVMGHEPIKSVNEFIKNQQKTKSESTLTVISFSYYTKKIIENKPIQEVKEISQDEYVPSGSTSLDDCVCCLISKHLYSNKVNDVILLIITDGQDTSSVHYNRQQTKKYLELVQKKHKWQILFFGANINTFEEGSTLGIKSNCVQFNQNCPGNLITLMKTASDKITDYKRAKTRGGKNITLSVPLQSSKSEPISIRNFSGPNFPIPSLII